MSVWEKSIVEISTGSIASCYWRAQMIDNYQSDTECEFGNMQAAVCTPWEWDFSVWTRSWHCRPLLARGTSSLHRSQLWPNGKWHVAKPERYAQFFIVLCVCVCKCVCVCVCVLIESGSFYDALKLRNGRHSFLSLRVSASPDSPFDCTFPSSVSEQFWLRLLIFLIKSK